MKKLSFPKKDNLLIYTSSEKDSDLFYASSFLAPDPFLFLTNKGKSFLLMNELEYGRAKKESSVDHILAYAKYRELALNRLKKNKRKTEKDLVFADIISELLFEFGVKKIHVPAAFPVYLADSLRQRNIQVLPKKDPFFENRTIKTEAEIKQIRYCQRQNEKGLDWLIQILKKSKIKENYILYQGKKLTSEFLKKEYEKLMLELGFAVQSTIVACGKDSADPHNNGKGILRPHKPIIIDLFPQDKKSRYWGDLTRTVVKGKAGDRVKKIWETVRAGQKNAIGKIKDGINAKEIHNDIVNYFEKCGFPTKYENDHFTGFIHGTGHGIGLDIHEGPRVSKKDQILKEGNVITVEPGLYYPDVGGVRIEDIIVVKKDRAINLNRYPKFLEIP